MPAKKKKVNSDSPVATDLYGSSNYIRDQPGCPGGGTYVLNDVQSKPTCSVAGHTL